MFTFLRISKSVFSMAPALAAANLPMVSSERKTPIFLSAFSAVWRNQNRVFDLKLTR
jgi:hypothetical protein